MKIVVHLTLDSVYLSRVILPVSETVRKIKLPALLENPLLVILKTREINHHRESCAVASDAHVCPTAVQNRNKVCSVRGPGIFALTIGAGTGFWLCKNQRNRRRNLILQRFDCIENELCILRRLIIGDG